jgi:hypothetical protein
MQLVIVPSKFTKMVFENTAKKYNKAINSRIEVVPEYFDETIYTNKIQDSLEILNQIPESFRISISRTLAARTSWRRS